ncbi:MAG: hypothetical protein HFI75_05455 [Lachnospiraceae bacterium]|nr:hypothetical protein [Lachnospiraceae bacterium]
MKRFTIIFGVLLVLCGVSCICTPVMTFLGAGYFLVILLVTYGLMGIIRAVVQKEYGVDFLFGILSMILGGVILFVPGLKLKTDGVLAYLMAAWILLQGAVSIFLAVRQKKAGAGMGWLWTMILGVLGVLVGIYSLAHPLLMAFTFGILVGIYFIESGIQMIVLAQCIQSK